MCEQPRHRRQSVESFFATAPLISDLWADPQERFAIFKNNLPDGGIGRVEQTEKACRFVPG
jgi:hypothetical protein